MPDRKFRCGYIAVVGRPNVGKSTLINTLVGSKVSIVSPKPQTTRHRILGLYNDEHFQAVFVDTPGLHRTQGKAMNRLMNKTAVSALQDADLVLFMSEAYRWLAEDEGALERVVQSNRPTIALLNKTDKVRPKERLLPALSAMAARHNFDQIIPVCAKQIQELQALLKQIPAYLPESPPMFPPDMLTDRNEHFQAAEIIREKLTLLLRDELPYGITAQIEKYEMQAEGVEIGAIIWVERDSQKGIVVGKGGAVLKQVGTAARKELKHRLNLPVHLSLWVKVKDNWADNEQELLRLGYESP